MENISQTSLFLKHYHRFSMVALLHTHCFKEVLTEVSNSLVSETLAKRGVIAGLDLNALDRSCAAQLPNPS